MGFKSFIPAIVILLIGFIVTIVGSLFKIQHWPYGNTLLIVASIIKVTAIVLAIIQLLLYFRKKA